MGEPPILVTGAAGTFGGVGRAVAERLLARGVPVRALVHHDDARATELRVLGAQVLTGDLTRAPDVVRALTGCRRMYFGLGVSLQYLEATATVAAVARRLGGLEILVNMSQGTVAQMNLASRTESEQQRLHWLAEQVLDWSGLPVVHLRPTFFLQSLWRLVAGSVARDGTIPLPFGEGRTSPVDVADVADVIVAVLTHGGAHANRVHELTGPRSETMAEIAAEFTAALGRTIRYVEVPLDPWCEDLRRRGLPEHTVEHMAAVARLHAANRYDRLTDAVERIAGHPATTVTEFVAQHARELGAATGDQPGAHV